MKDYKLNSPGVAIKQPSPRNSSILVLLFTSIFIFAIFELLLIRDTSLKAKLSLIFLFFSKHLIFKGDNL